MRRNDPLTPGAPSAGHRARILDGRRAPEADSRGFPGLQRGTLCLTANHERFALFLLIDVLQIRRGTQ